ncbi:MAG: SRPBCC domain-containing protein [Burkholderiales bacterium]
MNAPQTFDLNISRFIRAPRERVFDAFVTQEMVKKWMCPRGMGLAALTMDARVGGRYLFTMQSRDRQQFVVGGEYKEIKRPECISYTWAWQGGPMDNTETLVTVRFEARDGGTEVRMHHTGFANAMSRDSHGTGWNATLNKLVDATDEGGSAASIAVIGDARSTYVRTVRMALAEKGVLYTHNNVAPHSPEVLAISPFGKVPVFRDGDLQLFETTAIVRYIDECFDGTPLLPYDSRGRACCEQWVSAINSYMYDAMVKRYVLAYLFAKDGKPDRAVIDAALPDIRTQLGILDKAYGNGDWLAGGALSMADLLLAPILAYVEMMAEGGQLLAAVPNLARAQAVIRARPSFAATQPQLG